MAQYTTTLHRPVTGEEVPLGEPGSYDAAGATYVLVNDISSSRSAIFLGKDVILDLNGYTITYADGEYEHLPNYSFEEGLTNWDFSKAPGAKIEDKKVQVFVGDKVLRLQQGEEITSQYISLPVANRSYFAMCGVTNSEMSVSVYVEDETGEQVRCTNKYGSSQLQGSPVEKKSPRLGGGFVYAHLKDIPAGKYRIRIKAETDCIIDHIDIRPAMDVGIGIIEKTRTYAHVNHLYDGWWGHSAFYDYTLDYSKSIPINGLPVVQGGGTITIKNGIIKSGATGILSWGIQSTAANVKIILDNVKIISSGINTNAIDVPQATITNCLFDIQSPFIINRHGSANYAVDLGNGKGSEVSFSEFYGGQGCLSFRGDSTLIHDNFFANRQTVTNHYSIMTGADNAKIYKNRFVPEIGSGIEIYKKKNIEIYDNEFVIEAAPPSCEYGHDNYSTNAIRLADYNATPGAADGCYGNKIYNNRFSVTGKDFPEYLKYVPVATAIFYSASGGDNYIYNNEIEVTDTDPGSKNETVAFYVGGGSIGGVFENNVITSNVPAFWIASMYGAASGTKVNNNTFIRSPDAGPEYAQVRMGYWTYLATNIEFRSNIIEDNGLGIKATSRSHSYSVYWTLTVTVADEDGNALEGADVEIRDENNNVVFKDTTSGNGIIKTELREYSFENMGVIESAPYQVIVGDNVIEVPLKKNTEITITVDKVTGIPQNRNYPEWFTISPNPADKELTIDFSRRSKRSVIVLDSSQKVHLKFITDNEKEVLDISFLTPGIYFLKVTDQGEFVTKKFIKL